MVTGVRDEAPVWRIDPMALSQMRPLVPVDSPEGYRFVQMLLRVYLGRNLEHVRR